MSKYQPLFCSGTAAPVILGLSLPFPFFWCRSPSLLCLCCPLPLFSLPFFPFPPFLLLGLFDGLYIHDHPTPDRNNMFVLHIELPGKFTGVTAYDATINGAIIGLLNAHPELRKAMESELKDIRDSSIPGMHDPSSVLDTLSRAVDTVAGPGKLLVLVDEDDRAHGPAAQQARRRSQRQV